MLCMQSLTTIGYEMKKTLADRKSDNNNKNNNIGGAWRPVSGSKDNDKFLPLQLLSRSRSLLQ